MWKDFAQKVINFAYEYLPVSAPVFGVLENAKIVAHRGWHDGKTKENTLEAFQIAVKHGLYGIEFDVRWTKDLVPVVHHDPDCSRVWGKPLVIANIDFKDLRSEIPDIPTLEEVVDQFERQIHMFIELKLERFPQIDKQKKILIHTLKRLSPVEDFHLITLHNEVFEQFNIYTREAKMLVATTNTKLISEQCLDNDYAGLLGYCFLTNNEDIKKHQTIGQKVGVGFCESRNNFYRQLNRNVDYIFTNRPWLLINS